MGFITTDKCPQPLMMSQMKKGRELIRKVRTDGALPTTAFVFDRLITDPAIAPTVKKLLGYVRFQQLHAFPKLGYLPDINNPQSFNEKVLHRMVFTDKKIFSTLHDKYKVRQFVSDQVGTDILNDLYDVASNPAQISFESIPRPFVIKPTVGSGPVIFVKKGDSIDTNAITKTCEEWLAMDHSRKIATGHYWYRDADSRIIVERSLRQEGHTVPLDYKFYVFHGRVEYVHVDFNRFNDLERRFFDREWFAKGFKKGGVALGPAIAKPEKFDEMVEIAEQLATEFQFMRVDLYHPDDETIIFGEMTMAPGAGRSAFYPREVDYRFGALW